MKRVRYDPDAEAEYIGAVEWYAARNAVVAHRFIDAILEVEAMVQENPGQWPTVDTVPHELDVRRCLVEDFPFALVYVELDNEILILAVAHGKRRPGYWRERLPPPSG